MAKYSDIKGFTVQTLSTDTVASQFAGGAWASGGALNQGRGENAGNGVGTQTAAALAGGSGPPGVFANHEQYDGSSWTETTDLNTARNATWADGTQSAFWVAGGHIPPYTNITETWNGSSWTEVNNLNTTRGSGGGTCGRSSTAGLVVAGYTGTANTNVVEQWDGTNWTETGDLNSARRKATGFGTATAAFAVGASPSPGNPGLDDRVESWDGSSWTETTEINTGRGASSAAGTATEGLIAGSEQTPTRALTEHWNGTTWTELADLGTARGNFAGSGGTASDAWAAGGFEPTPGASTLTEEFTAPSDFVQIHEGQLFFNSTANAFKETITDIPPTTWASGDNLNTGRSGSGGAGIQTASLVFGGGSPDSTGATEQYNGSAWTEVNDLNTARKGLFNGLGLSYSAAVCTGGLPAPGGSGVAINESWNGSSWTETNDINSARRNGASSGSSTSGIISGGRPDSAPTGTGATELWDGTSWTETTDLNTARWVCEGVGQNSSSALNIMGYTNTRVNNVEQWDGSSWTEIAEANTTRYSMGVTVASPVNSALIYGGESPASTPGENHTEFWNGTSWTELNNLSQARWDITGSGTGGASALAAGGNQSPTAGTEEWTADLTNKTITAS